MQMEFQLVYLCMRERERGRERMQESKNEGVCLEEEVIMVVRDKNKRYWWDEVFIHLFIFKKL